MIRLIIADFLHPIFLFQHKTSVVQVIEFDKEIAEKLIEFAISKKIPIYTYSKSYKTKTYSIEKLDDFTIFLLHSDTFIDSYLIVRYPPYERIKEFIAEFIEYVKRNYPSLQEYLYSLYYILNPP